MAQLKINGNTVAVAVAAFGIIGWLVALAGGVIGCTSAARIQLSCIPGVRTAEMWYAHVMRAIHASVCCRAGVGASQSKCTELSGATFCGKLLQSHWWAVWFNFFLLIAVVILVRPSRNCSCRSDAAAAAVCW